MTIDNEPWKVDYIEACAHAKARDYEKALLKVNKILIFDKNNIYARNLKASILIDSWNGVAKTKHSIFEAITHLEKIIQEDAKNKNRYLMKLGHAFYRLAEEDLIAEGKLNPNIIKDLETAKRCFQESLSNCEDQPDVWIFYGSVLDCLGRHFEALYCYDKAILLNPRHYNAWGERGICCWRLSKLIENEEDKKKLYFDAMIYLAIELELHPSFDIEDSYKKLVNDFIQQNKIEINLEAFLKEQLPKKKITDKEHFNLFTEYEVSFKDFYFNFCEMHSLFLNTHFDCKNCGCSTLDLIDVKFTCDINDNIRPYKFFKKWYSLIDDYRTARFYLTLAQYRHQDFIFLDKPRYERDFSLNYYMNVEILKSAFLIAFNIYDKVAFLLNDYEELGLKDGDVSFWNGKSIFTINGMNLLKQNDWNVNLVALYSIKKEIEGRKEFVTIKSIRNSIAHRYFILSDIVNVEKSNYNMDIQEFFQSTLNVLLQIKNILFSLTFFITEKENCKNEIAEKNGKIIPKLEMVHDWEKDDEITKSAKNLGKELCEAYDKLMPNIFEMIDKEMDGRGKRNN